MNDIGYPRNGYYQISSDNFLGYHEKKIGADKFKLFKFRITQPILNSTTDIVIIPVSENNSIPVDFVNFAKEFEP